MAKFNFSQFIDLNVADQEIHCWLIYELIYKQLRSSSVSAEICVLLIRIFVVG